MHCRLAGVALVVPFVNYKWRTLPNDLVKDDYRKQLSRWGVWITRYARGLLHWWFTQKFFPSASVLEGNPQFFCERDLEVLKNTPGYQLFTQVPFHSEDKSTLFVWSAVSVSLVSVTLFWLLSVKATSLLASVNMVNLIICCTFNLQDGLKDRSVFDSLCSDLIVAFGKWDFNPLELTDPYPQNESSIHIWQGVKDKVVPVQLQRHVSQRLPWIRYHEVPECGHLLVYDTAVCEAVLTSLLLGEDPPLYRPKLADH